MSNNRKEVYRGRRLEMVRVVPHRIGLPEHPNRYCLVENTRSIRGHILRHGKRVCRNSRPRLPWDPFRRGDIVQKSLDLHQQRPTLAPIPILLNSLKHLRQCPALVVNASGSVPSSTSVRSRAAHRCLYVLRCRRHTTTFPRWVHLVFSAYRAELWPVASYRHYHLAAPADSVLKGQFNGASEMAQSVTAANDVRSEYRNQRRLGVGMVMPPSDPHRRRDIAVAHAAALRQCARGRRMGRQPSASRRG